MSKWNYKVVKSQRGGQGQWFNYPTAATFVTLAEAEVYAERFAREQAEVGGTRILIRSRKGADGGDVVKVYRCEEYRTATA